MSPEPGTALRVMVLDDEPIVGRRLRPALEKRGIEAEVFTDPLQARARLETTAFDIVVSDVKMRGLDGLSLLQEIRARGARTKVILITGFPSDELVREALSRGAFDLIAKPFKISSLLGVIARAAQALGHPGFGVGEIE
jgi:DNA-binding NtrC family response regulator